MTDTEQPYTPSLDEGRVFYVAERLDGRHLAGFPEPTVEQAEAEFDRMIAAHDAAVRQEEREKAAPETVDDLIETTAGLALANAAWQEGASTMLRSVNEHDDGAPGHRKPWSKPVSPYSAPLLARIKASREGQEPMTVDSDPSADEYRETIAFLRENADGLGIRAQGKEQDRG